MGTKSYLMKGLHIYLPLKGKKVRFAETQVTLQNLHMLGKEQTNHLEGWSLTKVEMPMKQS